MSQRNESTGGCLILVSTPIGNLEDLSPRARLALETSKYVIAEDTRVYFDLLRLVNISSEGVTALALHDHNQDQLQKPLQWLADGHNVLMVSDAGSPLVSDPAYPLVKAALELGHQLETCPGPSAVLVALELSGLPPHPFSFHGFLARESGKRKTQFEELLTQSGTHIVFEAPHRIIDALDELSQLAPANLEIAVARELTKKFQTIHRFKASEWAQVKTDLMVKGEFVVLFHVGKNSLSSTSNRELKEMAQKYLDKPSTKGSAKLIAKILDLETQEVYERLSKK